MTQKRKVSKQLINQCDYEKLMSEIKKKLQLTTSRLVFACNRNRTTRKRNCDTPAC